MAFQIIRNDITKVSADAIVNTANPEPKYVSETDYEIYTAATPTFALSVRYIIHTVEPVWVDGKHGECEAVRNCYLNSLKLAKELGCESIAFPLIAAGGYGFPKADALQIAVSVFSEFLAETDMQITLVVSDEASFVLSGKIFSGVDAFIDENYVAEWFDEEECAEKPIMAASMAIAAAAESKPERTLDDLMAHVGETWQESLFRLIDEKGYTDTEVYKRANIDRKLFSKIRSNSEYQPKKITAVAFALALGLSLDETKDLLGRAGYALSPSSRFDLSIEYFIGQGVYDTYTINLALFEHKQPLLGE